MTSENYNTVQKKIYFKAYKQLSLLEDALKHIKEQGFTHFQISILGKVSQFYCDKESEISKDTETLKMYWGELLESTNNFGNFYNREIGNVFIAGTLAPTFLYKIDGKTLGMLSAGPYGILRGIGASETQATTQLELLNNGSYLLIFRGLANELENLKKVLKEREDG